MEFLNEAALQAAAAVLLVHQILKLNIVPLAFANRYPVPTNVLLSILATFLIVRPQLDFSNWLQIAMQVGTISVIAAIAYNQLLSRWTELKQAEGTPER